MNEKCLIITGGEVIDNKRLLKLVRESSYIICADRGAETAFKLSIRPDIILGDLDSINSEILKKMDVRIIDYPTDKDFTDTELAILHAVDMGYNKIDVVNATGNRMDHVFSTFLLLYKYDTIDIRIVGSHFEAFLLREDLKIFHQKGRILSIIPVGDSLENIYLTGFKFPLIGQSVSVGDSLCVSNIIIEDEAEIKLSKGKAIIIITDQEEQYD